MKQREIGLGFQGDKRPGDYAQLARIAELHGVDVLSVYADLMYQPPIGPLLEMAGATTQVRLGPACLNPYSMHPYEIAGQAALLDLVSGGRSYLGLARGTWLGAVSIDQTAPLTYLAESAAVVSALLAGDTEGVAGEVFQLEPGVTLHYEVERSRVPLLIGTWGPRTLALAGRIADEVKVGGSANPDIVPFVRDRIAYGAKRSGRDAGEIGVVMGAVCVVDEDGDAARALARTEAAVYLAVVAELDPTVDVPTDLLGFVRERVARGDHHEAGKAIPDALLDRFAISGTPEQVAAHASALFAAGVDRVDFGTPHGLSAQRGVELLGTRVLPLIRR